MRRLQSVRYRAIILPNSAANLLELKKYVSFHHHHHVCFPVTPQTSTGAVLKLRKLSKKTLPFPCNFSLFVYTFNSSLTLFQYSNLILSLMSSEPSIYLFQLSFFYHRRLLTGLITLERTLLPLSSLFQPPSSSSLSDYLLVSLQALSLIESMPGWHAWQWDS